MAYFKNISEAYTKKGIGGMLSVLLTYKFRSFFADKIRSKQLASDGLVLQWVQNEVINCETVKFFKVTCSCNRQ